MIQAALGGAVTVLAFAAICGGVLLLAGCGS